MAVFPGRVPDLENIGPIIEVIIFPPEPVFKKFQEEGKPIPRKKVIALIDTGASCSCIDVSVAIELNLIAHDVVPILTPSGESMQSVYDLGLGFPTLSSNIIAVQAVGSDLAKQPYQSLIGRDILKHCTLVYNGWDNSYNLHL